MTARFKFQILRSLLEEVREINIARAAEGSGKLLSLLISREEPVFKRLLDYHGDILHRIRGHFNHG
jgi:hypothetical protein